MSGDASQQQEPIDRLEQRVRVRRLRESRVGESSHFVLAERLELRRMDHAEQRRVLASQLLEPDEPGEPRHVQIRDHGIERSLGEHGQRSFPAWRGADLEVGAQRAERSFEAAGHHRVIVDQQEAPQRRGGLRAGSWDRRLHIEPFCKSQADRSAIFAGRAPRLAPGPDLGIVPLDMEPGLVTLAKIVGTLLFGMGVIPILFLMSGGDMTEPEDRLDSEHKG